MTKVQVRPNRPVYPTPAALITCADEAGKPNIITMIATGRLNGFAFVLDEFWTFGHKLERG